MDQLIYYLNNRSPKIVRSLAAQGTGTFDVEGGQEFRLRVRPAWDDELVLDVVMDADTNSDEVSYQPADGDFDTEGLYRAWISVDLGGGIVQDTDEFDLAVFAHAPGEGTRVGAIWRACRALSPIAWDALRGYTDYGDVELQRQIELAKLRVLSSAVVAADEDSLDLRVIDYIAKRALVDNVLEAAIGYWTNVVVSQSSQSNSAEIHSYPDRIRATETQLKRLQEHLDRQESEVTAIIGSSPGTKSSAPALIGGGLPITPGLDEMPQSMRPRRAFMAGDCR